MTSTLGGPTVLLLGESWFSYTIHQKGFDSFATSSYELGCGPFIKQLTARGAQVTHVPSHMVPDMVNSLEDYFQMADIVVLSDIGSNTLLLTPTVFTEGKRAPNILDKIVQFIENGGGFLMVGGYLSFSGIEGKANYKNTILHDVLPVEVSIGDDRVENPSGSVPQVADSTHPIVRQVGGPWPAVLGYNRVKAREAARVVLTVGDDPLLVVGTYGRGRTAAYLSDLGPHWASREFMGWEGYGDFWYSLILWLSATETEFSKVAKIDDTATSTGAV